MSRSHRTSAVTLGQTTIVAATFLTCLTAAHAQSFNCVGDTKPDDIAICNDPNLAAKDIQLASKYSKLRSTLDKEGQRSLAAMEKAALAQRAICGVGVDCISHWFDRRISEIDLALRSEQAGDVDAAAAARPDPLPACDTPEVVIDALKVHSQSSIYGRVGAFGWVNMTFINLMMLKSAEAQGINHNRELKECKATFTCDIDQAKRIEENLDGPHPLTATCFQINQADQMGNPFTIHYTIQSSGEADQWTVTNLD